MGRSTPRAEFEAARPSPAALAAIKAKLVEVIEPVVAQAGYELDDLSVKVAGRRHIVRLMVDGDDGVSLDSIAVVSRAVSRALDDAEESGRELVKGEYQLEVSSPGVDRPLTKPAHWRRNLNRMVKVKSGERSYTGRITAADDQGVTLDVDGTAHLLSHASLGPGRVQIEFRRLEEISDEDLEEFGDDSEDEEAER